MRDLVEILNLAAFKMIAKRTFCIWDGVSLNFEFTWWV